jgi:hypothetical protein
MNRGIEDLVEFIGNKFGAYKKQLKINSVTSFSGLLDTHGLFTNSEIEEKKSTPISDSDEELENSYFHL